MIFMEIQKYAYRIWSDGLKNHTTYRKSVLYIKCFIFLYSLFETFFCTEKYLASYAWLQKQKYVFMWSDN
jgi:hypothetical protein